MSNFKTWAQQAAANNMDAETFLREVVGYSSNTIALEQATASLEAEMSAFAASRPGMVMEECHAA